MTGKKRRTLRAGIVAATALLLTAATAVPVAAHDDRGRHGRGKAVKVYHAHPVARGWSAPPPPAPPRPIAISRARVVTVPRAIHVYQRPAYAPYYAGTVYYEPYADYLQVYYFPVQLGTRIVYQPYYYYDGELFATYESGAPRFYFQLRF